MELLLKSILPAVLAGATLALTACGGNSNSPLPVQTQPVTQSAKPASTTITFRVPIGVAPVGAPSARSHVKRYFLDGSSNGYITMFFDGTSVMNAQSFAGDGTPGDTGPSGSATLPGGGSFSYTSQIVSGPNGSNQVYAQVTGNFATFQGQHTIGIVQTNGPCLYGNGDPSQGPCLSTTDGYVLAEGQQTFMLQPGVNSTPVQMYLQGVMQSAYICDAGCDGSVGSMDSNGAYDLYVVPTDENGTAIPYQLEADGTTVVPFDNGSWQFEEADSNNVVDITQAAPSYSVPGTVRHGSYGEDATVKCKAVGSATLAAVLVPGGPSAGTVTGFTYTSANYPAAGSILGSVGSNNYFGGPLTITCSASGSITVQ
jgi:hypothetical protein